MTGTAIGRDRVQDIEVYRLADHRTTAFIH